MSDGTADPAALAAALLRRFDGPSGDDEAEEAEEEAVLDLVGEACRGSPAHSRLAALRVTVEAGEASYAEIWRDPSRHGQAGLDLVLAVLRRAADLGR